MNKIIILLILILFSKNSYSQLPNHNMYLVKNLNEHLGIGSYSSVWGYVAANGREYAMLGCYTGTAFIDVTDSANIHDVDYLPGSSSAWREMKTYSHYAYIVSEGNNSRLQIVDLQYMPDSVHLVKTFSYPGFTRAHTISQSGHYLYLNGGNATPNGGITVLDISDPVNPVKLGQWTTLYVHDCRVVNDTIYAANISDGKVSIINAVNKNLLSTITSFNNLIGSGPHNTALSQNNKRLFVTDEIGSAPHLLKIWNIEDKSNITYVTNWQPTGIQNSIVHNIEVNGNLGIIAHYSAGVRVIDISNPDAPVEIAWYDTFLDNDNENFDGCWGVYMLPSGKILASDTYKGLFVLKMEYLKSIPINLNIKLLFEGMYNTAFNMLSRKDAATAYLRETSSPFNIIDSANGNIDSLTFTGSFNFFNAPDGVYYISVKHLNTIETWSRYGGEYLENTGTASYDFTSSEEQAYGNNLKLKGSSYCLYSGDVNKVGAITLFDVILIYNDAVNFTSGYKLINDLNGDSFVDLADVTLSYNNSTYFITVIKP